MSELFPTQQANDHCLIARPCDVQSTWWHTWSVAPGSTPFWRQLPQRRPLLQTLEPPHAWTPAGVSVVEGLDTRREPLPLPVVCVYLPTNTHANFIHCPGVSVVEDLDKRREPLPLPAVYFITPSPASVARLVADFSGATPLYPSAHVFFSSRCGCCVHFSCVCVWRAWWPTAAAPPRCTPLHTCSSAAGGGLGGYL